MDFSFGKLIIVLGGWFLCWITLHTIALVYATDVTVVLALQDAIVTNIVVALAAYSMVIIMRYYQPKRPLRVIWSVALTAFSVIIIRYFLHQLAPEPLYLAMVEKTLPLRAVFVWLMISIIAMMSWLWNYMREKKEDEERKATAEKLLRDAELANLRQQLQPHFLFNSLNSISALIAIKPDEARKMIEQLSEFLRGTVKRDDQQLVPLKDELRHLQLYLDIEKVRFGHRLSTEVLHNDEVLDLKLPTLLLQPLVENAIKFGLYDTLGEIIIRIRAQRENNNLLIAIENPFDERTSAGRAGTGFGLAFVQRRLYLLYGRNDLVMTSRNESIFTTTVRIPQ